MIAARRVRDAATFSGWGSQWGFNGRTEADYLVPLRAGVLMFGLYSDYLRDVCSTPENAS